MRLSLNRPVRLFVDSNMDVAANLQQEFVRIRANREDDREAVIMGLCWCLAGCPRVHSSCFSVHLCNLVYF